MLLAGVSSGRAALHLAAMAAAVPTALATTYLLMAMIVGGELSFRNPALQNATAGMAGTIFIGVGLSAVALLLVGFARAGSGALGVASRCVWLDVLLGPAVTAASFAAFYVLLFFAWAFWPDAFRQLAKNNERIELMMPDVSTVTLCLTMVVVAAYEELLFRGFLLTHLRRITRRWWAAVLLSSALFAAIHVGEGVGTQSPATAVPLFLIAILWSGVTIWRRSLIPAILGHALFNMLQVIFLRLLTTAEPI